jgi:hypothetical protein
LAWGVELSRVCCRGGTNMGKHAHHSRIGKASRRNFRAGTWRRSLGGETVPEAGVPTPAGMSATVLAAHPSRFSRTASSWALKQRPPFPLNFGVSSGPELVWTKVVNLLLGLPSCAAIHFSHRPRCRPEGRNGPSGLGRRLLLVLAQVR